MAEYRVLYNPYSGNGRGEKEAEKLKERLKEDQLTYQDITTVSDYAAFFAALAPEEKVILAGGDGTLNHFINDTQGIEIPQKIYYFATGSGNDFLNDLGKTREDPPFLINQYLHDLPQVEVNGKTYRFLNGIGYGIDGYCCEVGDQMRAEGSKEINYTSIAIKGLLFAYHPTNAVVTVDGVTHTYSKVWLAPTMNGRFYGGGMMMAPQQERLNPEHTVSVVVLHSARKLKVLTTFPTIFKGEHTKHTDIVEVLTGHEITVSFDRPTALQVDGETVLGVTEYKAVSKVKEPVQA
jgi:diacylglycerol kinase family enzyme